MLRRVSFERRLRLGGELDDLDALLVEPFFHLLARESLAGDDGFGRLRFALAVLA